MSSTHERWILTFLLAVAVVGAAGTATAGHGAENGNYTVDLPFDSDHLPGDQNEGNASINHFAAGTPELFERGGAPDGIEALEFIVIENQDIDFSGCGSTNTAAFGIDRGNNRSGTQTDVSLLRYMEGSQFNDHSIVIDLYEGDDFVAPDDAPIHLNPEDEIVAHQGYQSQGGACYTMPSDPGWYQIDGMANGTTSSGDDAQVEMTSHYVYICECGSEEEAYSTLGPPPGQDNPYEDGGGDETSTATPTPAPVGSDTPEPTDAPTPTSGRATDTPTEPQSADGNGGGGEPTATAAQSSGENDGPTRTAPPTAQQSNVVTPTVAEGPGFGPAVALFALLGAALLALRRG